MLTAQEVKTRQEQAAAMIHRGGIFITQEERDRIEIVDFGLSRFEETGLGVLVYVNTERCCAKELALWPRQTCAQHRHHNDIGRHALAGGLGERRLHGVGPGGQLAQRLGREQHAHPHGQTPECVGFGVDVPEREQDVLHERMTNEDDGHAETIHEGLRGRLWVWRARCTAGVGRSRVG